MSERDRGIILQEHQVILLEGIERHIQNLTTVARRIECIVSGIAIPDDLKDVVFDELAPNGRLE